jgi:hypothetical protein
MIVKGPHGAMVKRPDPPRELDAAEAIEWRAIVASMPVGHFAPVHYPMLIQLCRHVIDARHIKHLIATARKKRKPNNREYSSLLRLQARESAMIMRLQKAMRLTQSAVMERTAIKKLRPVHSNGAASPWNRASA